MQYTHIATSTYIIHAIYLLRETLEFYKNKLQRKGNTHPKETDYLPQILLLESFYLFNMKVNFDITDY